MARLQSGWDYQSHRLAYILLTSLALNALGSVLPDFTYPVLYLLGIPFTGKEYHAEWAITGIVLLLIGTGYFISYLGRLRRTRILKGGESVSKNSIGR